MQIKNKSVKLFEKKLSAEKNSIYLIIGFFTILVFSYFNFSDLGPPDYYKYFLISKKLYSGIFNLRKIPPLFPLFMGIFGKIFSIFPGISDPLLTGSRIISLCGSTGIIILIFNFFTYLFDRKSAIIVSLFLISTPFFLKFTTVPLTDMIFTFFVLGTFYFIFLNKRIPSILFTILSVVTRFEGVLVFFVLILSLFRNQWKNRIKLLFYSISSITLLFLFYLNFGDRIIHKVKYIILDGFYLNFFKYPERLYSLFLKNILFFYRGDNFNIIGITLFLILMFFFIMGLIKLLSMNKFFVYSILFYILVFTISKGYISGVGNVFNAESQARRMLSLLLIFWTVVMTGLIHLYYLFKNRIKRKIKYTFFFIVPVITYLTLTSFPYPEKRIIILSLFFIFPLFYLTLFSFVQKIYQRIGISIIVLLFGLILTNYGINKASGYVESLPNKGAYMISGWIDSNLRDNEKIAVYSLTPMVEYYSETKAKIVKTYEKDENIYRDWKILEKKIIAKLKKYNIKYIATDFYMNLIDSPWSVAVKRMLYRNVKNKTSFKLKKRLFYKGRPVAMILTLKKSAGL